MHEVRSMEVIVVGTAPALALVPREEKVQRRRDELADAALITLGELGFARTTLRDIAENSALSHGVVHYYFHDKLELLGYCVRRYKQQCATRYDALVTTAATADELRDGFAAALRKTLVEDTAMHRLWYDMRAQSMFEPALREDVTAIDHLLEEMIWSVISRYAELLGVDAPKHRRLAYVTLDGLFDSALIGYHAGDTRAPAQLQQQAAVLLDQLVN